MTDDEALVPRVKRSTYQTVEIRDHERQLTLENLEAVAAYLKLAAKAEHELEIEAGDARPVKLRDLRKLAPEERKFIILSVTTEVASMWVMFFGLGHVEISYRANDPAAVGVAEQIAKYIRRLPGKSSRLRTWYTTAGGWIVAGIAVVACVINETLYFSNGSTFWFWFWLAIGIAADLVNFTWLRILHVRERRFGVHPYTQEELALRSKPARSWDGVITILAALTLLATVVIGVAQLLKG